MSKRRFKVFKRHLPEDWQVVTRWNGWPIRKVKKVKDGLWEVSWRRGICIRLVSFSTFAAAHAYVRERLYGTQNDYGYAC